MNSRLASFDKLRMRKVCAQLSIFEVSTNGPDPELVEGRTTARSTLQQAM